jgi:hypothetical protein
MMKLIEEYAGTGELKLNGESYPRVRYRIRRYQGFTEGSGLPVPGFHRIEGSIELDGAKDSSDLIGTTPDLRLEDGRMIRIAIADHSGRVLSEGHGPSKCLCC